MVVVRTLHRRTFAAAAVLAVIAGFVDGIGFVSLGGYFVSFMTGNTTRASVDLAQADWSGAGLALLLIVSFVVGVVGGTVIPTGRMRSETGVLVLVTGMVAVAAAAQTIGWPVAGGAALAFAMGAMNTVFARGGEVGFGITYMTGALVKLGQGLVTALRGGSRTAWVRHAVMWASIALGAAVGALVFSFVGAGALWGLALVMVVLLAIGPARRWLHV